MWSLLGYPEEEAPATAASAGETQPSSASSATEAAETPAAEDTGGGGLWSLLGYSATPEPTETPGAPPPTPVSDSGGGGFWSLWGASTPSEDQPSAVDTPGESEATAPAPQEEKTGGPEDGKKAEGGAAKEKKKKKKRREEGDEDESKSDKKSETEEDGESEKAKEKKKKKKKDGQSGEETSSPSAGGRQQISANEVDSMRARLEEIEREKKKKEEEKRKKKEEEKEERKKKKEEEKDEKKKKKEEERRKELEKLEEQLRKTEEEAQLLQKKKEEEKLSKKKSKKFGDSSRSPSRDSGSATPLSPSSSRSGRRSRSRDSQEDDEERRKRREDRERKRREEQERLDRLIEETERELSETARSLQESIERQKQEREAIEKARKEQLEHEQHLQTLAEQVIQQATLLNATPPSSSRFPLLSPSPPPPPSSPPLPPPPPPSSSGEILKKKKYPGVPPSAKKGGEIKPPKIAVASASPADVRARQFMKDIMARDIIPSLPPPPLPDEIAKQDEDEEKKKKKKKEEEAMISPREKGEASKRQGNLLFPAFSKKPEEFTDIIQLEKKMAPQHVLFRGPCFPAFQKLRQVYIQLEETQREAELKEKQRKAEMEAVKERYQRKLEEEKRALEATLRKAMAFASACDLLSKVVYTASSRNARTFFCLLREIVDEELRKTEGLCGGLQERIARAQQTREEHRRVACRLLVDLFMRRTRDAWNKCIRAILLQSDTEGEEGDESRNQLGIGVLRHEKAAAALLAFQCAEEDAEALKKISEKERRRLEEQEKYLARWKLQIGAMHDALVRLNNEEILRREEEKRRSEREQEKKKRSRDAFYRSLRRYDEDDFSPTVINRLDVLLEDELRRLGADPSCVRNSRDPPSYLQQRLLNPSGVTLDRPIPPAFQTYPLKALPGGPDLTYEDLDSHFYKDAVDADSPKRTPGRSKRRERGKGREKGDSRSFLSLSSRGGGGRVRSLSDHSSSDTSSPRSRSGLRERHRHHYDRGKIRDDDRYDGSSPTRVPLRYGRDDDSSQSPSSIGGEGGVVGGGIRTVGGSTTTPGGTPLGDVSSAEDSLSSSYLSRQRANEDSWRTREDGPSKKDKDTWERREKQDKDDDDVGRTEGRKIDDKDIDKGRRDSSVENKHVSFHEGRGSPSRKTSDKGESKPMLRRFSSSSSSSEEEEEGSRFSRKSSPILHKDHKSKPSPPPPPSLPSTLPSSSQAARHEDEDGKSSRALQRQDSQTKSSLVGKKSGGVGVGSLDNHLNTQTKKGSAPPPPPKGGEGATVTFVDMKSAMQSKAKVETAIQSKLKFSRKATILVGSGPPPSMTELQRKKTFASPPPSFPAKKKSS